MKHTPITPTLMDRAVTYFNPKKGLERIHSRMRMQAMADGGYIATDSSRRSMKSANFKALDSDSDDLLNLSKLRGVARDLYRNAPLVHGAIGTMKYNILGSGLKVQSHIDRQFLGLTEDEARVFEVQSERIFNFVADSTNIDAEHTSNFDELQSISLIGAMVSGDIFVAVPAIRRKDSPFTIAVQLIEADRCSNPNGAKDTKEIAGGVENDQYGAPKKYYFSTNHPDRKGVQNSWKSIDVFADSGRRNIHHVFEKVRPGQRRGVSVLASVIEPLKQLTDYTHAEITAAVVSSLFTVFIKSESGEGLDEDFMNYVPSEDTVSSELKLEAGAIIGLAEGESIESANPNRPNTAYDPFTQSIFRQIGAALHIPFEVLLKHFTSSYSASRAALLEAWKMFRARRSWFASKFCQPVYEEVITEAIYLGYLHAPGFLDNPMVRKAYLNTSWNGPAQGQLNPLQETNAASRRVEEGFSTRTKESAEMNGTDFDTNIERAKTETNAYIGSGLYGIKNPSTPTPDQGVTDE